MVEFPDFPALLRNLSCFDILERNQFPDYWQKDGLLAVGGGDFNASCFVFHDLKSNPRVTPRAKIRRKTKTSTQQQLSYSFLHGNIVQVSNNGPNQTYPAGAATWATFPTEDHFTQILILKLSNFLSNGFLMPFYSKFCLRFGYFGAQKSILFHLLTLLSVSLRYLR